MVLAPQLPPDFAHAIDSEVVIEDPAYLGLQGGVTLGSRRSLGRIGTPGDMSVISRRGDRQDSADRLDPMRLAMIVDEGDHGLNRRSSSAWAKYADALRRISLACRSSRFSRSSAFNRSTTSDGTPDRLSLAPSDLLTHSLSVCGVQPILPAIDTIAAHRDACSNSCSRTIRTARVRISGENLFVVLLVMAPPSQELEPPINPGRFSPTSA